MISYHQKYNSLGDRIFNTAIYENSSFFAHFHKSFELIYIMDGEFECSIDGRNYTFSEGEFALIFPYQLHSWRISSGKAYICVFSDSYVKTFAKGCEGRRCEKPAFRCSEDVRNYFLSTLLKEFPNHHFNLPPPSNPLPIKSALYGILNQFLIGEPLVKNSQESSEQLTYDMLVFISEHFNENITLSTLANALGYSYQHISRVFNQKINTPFKDFLNWYRFEYAKQLLTETDLSIAEVAHESGFQSIRNFNLICMKLSGRTPKELRRSAIIDE